jgi:hypothetical protein
MGKKSDAHSQGDIEALEFDSGYQEAKLQYDTLLKIKKGTNPEDPIFDEWILNHKEVLSNTATFEEEQKKRILILQKLLDKEDCPEAEKQLRGVFIGQKSDGIRLCGYYEMIAFAMVEELNIRETFKEIQEKQEFADTIKALKDFKKSLEKVLAFQKNKNVERFFRDIANRDDEPPMGMTIKDHNEFFANTTLRLITLDQVLKGQGAGRPSNNKLHEFVLYIAEIYQTLSGKKFTILRHRNTSGKNQGQYLPITNGHLFVCAAIDLAYFQCEDKDEQFPRYSLENIYNSCEKAQKQLEK